MSTAIQPGQTRCYRDNSAALLEDHGKWLDAASPRIARATGEPQEDCYQQLVLSLLEGSNRLQAYLKTWAFVERCWENPDFLDAIAGRRAPTRFHACPWSAEALAWIADQLQEFCKYVVKVHREGKSLCEVGELLGVSEQKAYRFWQEAVYVVEELNR